MATADSRELVPITVEFFVPDVDASVRFYTEKLGFQLQRLERGQIEGRDAATFAVISFERAAMLIAHASLGGDLPLPPGSATVHVRIVVEDVDAMYERVSAGGVEIAQEIADRDYGLRDFIIRDPDGFHIRFASPSL